MVGGPCPTVGVRLAFIVLGNSQVLVKSVDYREAIKRIILKY